LVVWRARSGTTTCTGAVPCTATANVSVSTPPAGVTASALTIPSGHTTGTLTLNVSASAGFQQTNLTVTATAAPASASQTLTLVVPRASGPFVEANPAPYTNSVIGASTNSLSGTFTVDIKSGAQAGVPQPRAAQFHKGTTNVGQAIGFTVGSSANLGGAGFCRDNNSAQPPLTRGVVMTSAPVGSNAQFAF